MTETVIWTGEHGSTLTRRDDAASILGADLADELEERVAALVDKSAATAPGALIVKSDADAWKPYGGALTIAGAEAFLAAQAADWEARDAWSVLQGVVENILGSTIVDKKTAIKTEVEQFVLKSKSEVHMSHNEKVIRASVGLAGAPPQTGQRGLTLAGLDRYCRASVGLTDPRPTPTGAQALTAAQAVQKSMTPQVAAPATNRAIMAERERVRELALLQQQMTRLQHGVPTAPFTELPGSSLRATVRRSMGLPAAGDPVQVRAPQVRQSRALRAPDMRAAVSEALAPYIAKIDRQLVQAQRGLGQRRQVATRQAQRSVQSHAAVGQPAQPQLVERSRCPITGAPVETWRTANGAVVQHYPGSMSQPGNLVAGLQDAMGQIKPPPSIVSRGESRRW